MLFSPMASFSSISAPVASPSLMPPSLPWPFSALSHVKGLHLNMAFILRNFYTLTLLLGWRFGRLFGYTKRDMELMYSLKKIFFNLVRESGYLHIQSTKPDTVGEWAGGEKPGSVVRVGWAYIHSIQQGFQPGGSLTHPRNTVHGVKTSCEKLRAPSTLTRHFSTDMSDAWS